MGFTYISERIEEMEKGVTFIVFSSKSAILDDK